MQIYAVLGTNTTIQEEPISQVSIEFLISLKLWQLNTIGQLIVRYYTCTLLTSGIHLILSMFNIPHIQDCI